MAAFAGSAWRGAFGHALRRLVCIARQRERCEGCAVEASCLDTTVFEARPPPGAAMMRRYNRVPHPYVLGPRTPTPCRLAPGDRFVLVLRLVGRAAAHAVYGVRALEEAARHGIGAGRGRLALEAVIPEGAGDDPWQPRPLEVPPAPPRVRVHLERPLRLAVDGRLLGPERFDLGAFLMALVRRVSIFCSFYGEAPLALDFRALRDRAHSLRAEAMMLGWREQRRRSARQGRLVPMGGVVGHFELDLRDGAKVFWPFLHAGQWLHLGKGATMGMGRLRLEALPAGLPRIDQPRSTDTWVLREHDVDGP